ncbi:MAG: hypothetical protein ACREEM_22250 [Blastocatellia bacterium]
MTRLRLCGILLTLAFAIVLSSRLSISHAVTTPLTWAPPAGWESYTIVTIPNSGGTINLSDTI